MRRFWICSLLLALVAGGAVADGPETGLVSGKVTDSSGAPIPGVGVTITGDRGEKFTQTEADGSYRFVLLVPGNYVVRAELEGMGKAEKPVNVTAGQRTEIDLELRLATEETITVTSEAPLVDKFNVGVGQTLQSKVGVEVTGENRTFYGVINFMPGTTNEDENADLASTRPNINGATWADSTVYIDGVDTTFSRYGGTRVFLPSSATTEVSLESGGLGADYGRTVGSATNVIVKSGTNNFHGEGLYSRTEESWNSEFKEHPEMELRQTNPQPRDFFRRTSEEKDASDDQYETSLGGPIVKDKAWFFISANRLNSNQIGRAINKDFIDESGTTESRIAKFNLQPAPKHSLAISYMDTPVLRNFVLDQVFDRYGPTPHDISGELYTASYNVSLSQSLFLEAKLADQTSNEDKLLAFGGFDVNAAIAVKQQDPRFPPNPAAGKDWPGNTYNVYLDSDGWHNGWLLDNGYGTNEFPRTQANLAMTQFVGSDHELKYGVDAQEVKWNSDVQRVDLYSGQGNNQFEALSRTGYRDVDLPEASQISGSCNFLVGGSSCILQDYHHPSLLADLGSGDTKSTNLALYLRDRFTVGDHWTFNLGVRGENQKHENDIGREVMDSTDFSPRGSMAYDINGNGRQLITLSLGRAYHQLPQEAVNQYMMDQFNGYNGYERRLYCSPTNAFLGNAGFLGATCRNTGVGYTSTLGFVRPGAMWDLVDQGVFESDIDAYHKDEAILGWEWQFGRNWAIKSDAIWWEVKDIIGSTTQLAEVDGRLTVFFLTANHTDYPEILNAVREAASPANQSRLAQADVLAGYEEPYREYQALQVQVNRRFSDNWALYSNVTWSESSGSSHGSVFNNTNDEYGENLEAVMLPQYITTCQSQQANRTNPRDCAAAWTPVLGQPLSTIYRDGLANYDRPIIAKTTGWKVFPITERQSFTLGGHATWQSGANWDRTESVSPTNPTGEPTSIAVTVPLEPEGSQTIASHWWLNLSGAYAFPVAKKVSGEFRVEVQNVTDNQDQLSSTSRGEVRTIRRGWQRPRRFRALASFRF